VANWWVGSVEVAGRLEGGGREVDRWGPARSGALPWAAGRQPGRIGPFRVSRGAGAVGKSMRWVGIGEPGRLGRGRPVGGGPKRS